MSYTETTTTSWFTRLKNGVIAIFIGILLVIGSVILLFWNEGRAITTYRALVEGAGLVISVSSAAPDVANDSKLVHISGTVAPQGTVADEDFSIAAEGAVGLTRTVEMYQWVQEEETKTEKNLGGSETTTTTYTYKKEWKDGRVASEDFKKPDGHDNPEMAISGSQIVVPEAKVGGFTLTGEQVAPLGKESAVRLSDDNVAAFADYLGADYNVEAKNGGIYVGNNPASPQVGDLRITYSRADLKDASFVGMQQGERIGNYTTTNGREIFLSAAGTVTAADMFKDAQSENTIITWLVRAGGILLMFIGFSMAFSLLSVIGDVIPFVGSIIGFGTTFLAFIMAVVIGPIIIAIGWFAYRPLLSIGIIGAGLLVGGLVWYLRKGRAAITPAPDQLGRAQS